MKPQPPTRDDWKRVYDAAVARRQLQEEEYQKGDGLGGCLCILVITVLAAIVYGGLFFMVF